MVEHRRFELLTPTLPVLCATNCANAPSTTISISCQFQLVKSEGRILKKNVGRTQKRPRGQEFVVLQISAGAKAGSERFLQSVD